MRSRRRSSGDAFANASALDMLSAGLGAVIVLMLIYSVLQGRRLYEQQRTALVVHVHSTLGSVSFDIQKHGGSESVTVSSDLTNEANDKLRNAGLALSLTTSSRRVAGDEAATSYWFLMHGVPPGQYRIELRNVEGVCEVRSMARIWTLSASNGAAAFNKLRVGGEQ